MRNIVDESPFYNKKIAVVTHYHIYGAPQALKDYFIKNKIKELYFVGHPLYSKKGEFHYEERIKKGNVSKKKFNLNSNINLIDYVFSIFINLKTFIFFKEKIDLYVGVNNLNAFCGILLKKIGHVKKVVYYTIDYVPKRFNNPLLNKIYHYLDKICVKNCDETWDVSPRILDGRFKFSKIKKTDYKSYKVVPIGIWFDKVRRIPFRNVKKTNLLFVGNLLEKQGLQHVIKAMPKIIKKIPEFHFLIVGGGEYESELKSLALKLDVQNHITFKGWIKDRNELDHIMADNALAIALYQKYDQNGNISFTYYADATKLKDYLSAGIPILMTDLPHNSNEIQKAGCGKIINVDSENILNGLLEYMGDVDKLEKARINAINYIKQFDWNIIFRRALENLL